MIHPGSLIILYCITDMESTWFCGWHQWLRARILAMHWQSGLTKSKQGFFDTGAELVINSLIRRTKLKCGKFLAPHGWESPPGNISYLGSPLSQWLNDMKWQVEIFTLWSASGPSSLHFFLTSTLNCWGRNSLIWGPIFSMCWWYPTISLGPRPNRQQSQNAVSVSWSQSGSGKKRCRLNPSETEILSFVGPLIPEKYHLWPQMELYSPIQRQLEVWSSS